VTPTKGGTTRLREREIHREGKEKDHNYGKLFSPKTRNIRITDGGRRSGSKNRNPGLKKRW